MKKTILHHSSDKEIFLKGKIPLFDIPFLILSLLLSVFGSLMVFSAGSAYAEFRYDDPFFFTKRQILWLILGIAIMLVASRIKPEFYFKITPFLYGITLILLLLVLAVGFVGNGAQRWISIGPLTIQPSEIAKMTIVMMLAYYFSKWGKKALDIKNKKNAFIYGTLIPCIIMGIPIVLVMLQKHLSCIIILGLIGLIVITVSGIDTKYIAGFTALGGVALIALGIRAWLKGRKNAKKVNWKTVGKVAFGVVAALLLGLGMSLILVWNELLIGILVGVVGIVMLLCLIPMFLGFKD